MVGKDRPQLDVGSSRRAKAPAPPRSRPGLVIHFALAGRGERARVAGMKAAITAKEYRQLLELVHLGMWTVTGYQGEDTAAAKRYYELDQKLLELATAAGCADLVETMDDGSLQPAPKLSEDDRVREIQSEFQNDVFWHELVTRLADRDIEGDQVKRAMDTPGVEPAPSRDDRLKKIEDRLWAEFEKNDLANIVLLRGGRG